MNAPLGRITGLATNLHGDVFASDADNHLVVRISADGILTVVAGTGQAGYSGDGGPARDAALNTPHGLALDASGNLYIADSGNSRLRKISPDGTITTFAVNGTIESGLPGCRMSRSTIPAMFMSQRATC